MSEKTQAVDAFASAIASKTTYVGSGAAFAAFFTSIESWIPWFGVGLAVIGYITNLVFQARRDKREREEHEQKMKGGCNVKD